MRLNRPMFVLPFLAACATVTNRPLDLATTTVVDLTYPFDAKTLYWPSSPSGFELKELARTAGVAGSGFTVRASIPITV